MTKLLITLAFVVTALLSNSLFPSVSTVTFRSNTTLTEVVDLLNANNTWAYNENFVIGNGLGFFYFKDSMSIAAREHAVWQGQRGLDEINGQAPDPVVIACIEKACPVSIAQITLLNPSTTLLESPLIASSHSHRQPHPFFLQGRILGRPQEP